MFVKGDVVVAKKGFIGDHETIKDTLGIVLEYTPENDYLVLGTLYPEKYAIPPTYSMRGECYRHVKKNELKEWGILP